MLKVVIFASWQANRDYIAQNLCENRDTPDSDCAGACQLAKQMENADETHAPFLPVKSIEKVELAVFDVAMATHLPQPLSNITNRYIYNDEALLPCNITFSVFHPPEMIV